MKKTKLPIRDNSKCCLSEYRECCCKCDFLYELCSHPFVDGKPITNHLGWVCIVMCVLDNGSAILSDGHGLCEMFTKKKERKLD